MRVGLVAIAGLLVGVAGASALYYWGATQRMALWWVQSQLPESERHGSVLGRDYQVTIDAKPITLADGLMLKNLSALSYDADRDILWTVSNSTPHMIALSKQGEVLRTVFLRGALDTESLEHMGGDRFAITDEELQKLWVFDLPPTATEVDMEHAHTMTFGPQSNNNKMFEGLAYDAVENRFFLGRERDPVSILEISGFPPADQNKPLDILLKRDSTREQQLFLQDLSALHYDWQTRHLLALSDQQATLLEWSTAGKVVASLSLRAGNHGLANTVPQGEGLAMGPAREIYIISEPNLFYRLDPVVR